MIPLSCTASIDNHLRYCSLICIMSLMIHIRVQYLTGHIIKVSTVEIRSLRPWTKVESKLSDSHFAESSWLTQGNVCCPNFQNTSLAGNFGPQIWLPDGHFGQFRAIGPMELLRPDIYIYIYQPTINPCSSLSSCSSEWLKSLFSVCNVCIWSPWSQTVKYS